MDIVADYKEEVEENLFWQSRELFDCGVDLAFLTPPRSTSRRGGGRRVL
jgi:hypothetical protein